MRQASALDVVGVVRKLDLNFMINPAGDARRLLAPQSFEQRGARSGSRAGTAGLRGVLRDAPPAAAAQSARDKPRRRSNSARGAQKRPISRPLPPPSYTSPRITSVRLFHYIRAAAKFGGAARKSREAVKNPRNTASRPQPEGRGGLRYLLPFAANLRRRRYFSSEVQCGHLVAFSFTSEKQ